MRKLIILVLILLLTSGCSVFNKKTADVDKGSSQIAKQLVDFKSVATTTVDILKSSVKPTIESDGATLYKDIVYAQTTDGTKLLLDLYLPKKQNNSPLPLIVFIHGGGWRSGSKDNCFAREQLVKYGYAAACVDYRLSGQAKFPAQINDIKAAVRWLRANAGEYNINPDKFGAWGNSAGAHLAVMLGVTGDVKELEGNVGVTAYSSRVRAVVDWYGPVEFSAIIPLKNKFQEYYEAATQLIGQPLESSPDLISKASPLSYLTADDPPILIMHGVKDGVVPFQQSQTLYNALKQKGIDAIYDLYPENDHEFHEERDYKKVVDFFDKHLK